ncbi:MAG: DUF2125 domain-containing protein [Parvibaculaceae bacterium]|nr:DUF2125 domain-containing protein [Parvibaculaceae bacterium]
MTTPATQEPAPRKQSRLGAWGIYLPTIALVVFVGLYWLFWNHMAGILESRVNEFRQTGDGTGLTADWQDFKVSGFPYRMQGAFTNPELADPQSPSNWHWEGGKLTVAVLPYNLKHIIVLPEGEQTVHYFTGSGDASQQHTLRLTAETARASYVVVPGSFGRVAVELQKLHLSDGLTAQEDANNAGPLLGLTADRAQFNLEPSGGEADSIPGDANVALQLENAVFDPLLNNPLFDTPLSFAGIEGRLRGVPAQPETDLKGLLQQWGEAEGSADIDALTIKWGTLDMTASGSLHLDAQHRPEGVLDAAFINPQAFVQTLVDKGVVSRQNASFALAGISAISNFQGASDGRVKLPVIFKDGKLYLGPLKISNVDPIY